MPSEPQVHGHCDPRFESVRRVFSENLKSGADLGAGVAFSLHGELVVDLWGGFLEPEGGEPWQRDTLVNLYSTTKGMVAICVQQLVERGQLDLDAPVAEYWPEFSAAGKQAIPVRQLLCHQAGLPAVRKPLETSVLYDWETFASALAAQEPWWEPGTRHGYHAITFGHLVGEVIRRISGESVGQFFRANVAEPLGVDFHIGLADKDHPRTSRLHGRLMGGDGSSGGGGSIPEPLKAFMRDMADPTTMTGGAFNNPRIPPDAVNTPEWRRAEIPAANGHGTARALARVYGALAQGGEIDGVRILETESIERAIAVQADGPDAVLGGMPMRFGLGFMLRSPIMPLSPNKRAFGHPGAGGSIGMADPDAGVGFGYTPNKMQMGLVGGAGGFAMLKTFFDAL
ncbi:MAG TPA: class A beta-lactamase-related serine hydrolase [Myxococcales bacterium]|nr:class A beta-lactamase-related serine hydrolase [Myxococcales bacterium]